MLKKTIIEFAASFANGSIYVAMEEHFKVFDVENLKLAPIP